MDSHDDRAHGRCIQSVLPKIAPVAALAADTLKAEAEVCHEEAEVLTLDARAKALFARLASLQARALEMGLQLEPPKRPRPASTQVMTPLPPEAFIDQRSGRVEKAIYLRLAREGAFPSKKIGKRILARWGDVQAALSVDPPAKLPRLEQEADAELDAIRARAGLAVRGGR